ncbi:MAG: outer membrane lipid asymmetry maintenance protein MlaD [Thermodesulfobacteriota bacterium]
MKKSTLELTVGVFVLIGIVCVSYLAIKLGQMEVFGEDYNVYEAKFQNVGGLTHGASVQMAGVEVGRVSSIVIDPQDKVAVVKIKVKKDMVLTDDVIASVKTSGLIGDKYVSLTPGGSDEVLQPGDRIYETESAVDIEELISKYVFGGV